MLRRRQYIAFSAVLVLAVIFLNLPSKTGTQIKLAMGGLFLPLLGLASSAQDLSQQARQTLVPRKLLIKELEELRLENERIRFELMQSGALWQENDELRRALDWRRQVPWEMKLGRVILRDPSNWWRTLHINLGSRDGMRTNLPVMTVEGLVGRISQVGYSTSQVVLVGDPNCRVAALVEETADHGIILGSPSSVRDFSMVDLKYLFPHHRVETGQAVVTSGIEGGIFPRGIPIGSVVDVSSVGFGMYSEARVRLAADLNHIEKVWVILQ